MEDWHGVVSKSSKGVSRRSTNTSEDFEEEDVWSSYASDYQQSCENSSPHMRKPFEEHCSSGSGSSSSSSSSAWRFSSTTAPRMIRRANNIPTATTTHEANKGVQQSSAPVKIPDWSKIYGKNANSLGSWVDDDHLHHDDGNGVNSNGHVVYNGTTRDYYHDHHGHCHGNDDDDDDDDDDDNEDGDDEMVPPHEWLAKKLARSQISSFSVCEGIGRTLKGRDLSKVRNEILTKTGFLEQ